MCRRGTERQKELMALRDESFGRCRQIYMLGRNAAGSIPTRIFPGITISNARAGAGQAD